MPPSAVSQRPKAASSGPFGMITSKATSKVTNITATKMKAASSDFHSRDLADEPHEAGDQDEARDVEAEERRQEHEEKRRHQHLQDAAELVAGDEGLFGERPLAHGDEKAVEARGAEHDREVEGEITGLGAVARPAGAQTPVVPPEHRGKRRSA